MSEVTLDRLLIGLPDVYHPAVTATWRHREGFRDPVELQAAVDGLLALASEVINMADDDRQADLRHPNRWRLDHQAWASAAWDDAEACPRDENGQIEWSHRGQFWLHFSAGNLAHAGGLLILIVGETQDELMGRP
ncbi:hypothetical protein KNU02_gp10 [Gordonia phage Pleakley]|uniref:Uncharacterized protein n=1 Tax=Gordonia phage Pleakley TaxID=2283246 RepID=A0A345M6C8_9CAUD|nr:hypothetical protein KNU02_gp10 [Gordonia phage Pleakley]AXH49736.1 hypothetical protein SEA_FURY_10 [Gordonia phage Fury]AXH66049.1 hypothetical protein SEA_PLEAKLEY_10 [Gordonia phage Pleakley]